MAEINRWMLFMKPGFVILLASLLTSEDCKYKLLWTFNFRFMWTLSCWKRGCRQSFFMRSELSHSSWLNSSSLSCISSKLSSHGSGVVLSPQAISSSHLSTSGCWFGTGRSSYQPNSCGLEQLVVWGTTLIQLNLSIYCHLFALGNVCFVNSFPWSIK